MLLIGIIMLTYYLTKAYNNNNKICSNNNHDTKEIHPSIDQVYNMRPSKIFNVMFNEPSIWQGYQTIDSKELPLGAKTLL